MPVIKTNYNDAIQCGGRLSLYNAETSQTFSGHILFTIDDRANFLLENKV